MHASLKHILSQPFVVATGFAALVHSTWSLATLFAGHEPEQLTGAWFAWVAPALLIALSVDLGQIVTAAEIRTGQRSRFKLATFGVFAVFTYGLQWYHLAHHIPALALAEGVRSEWRGFAQLISDAMVFLIPALLPLSTLLYTFSGSEMARHVPAAVPSQVIAPSQQVNVNILQPLAEPRQTIAAVHVEQPQPAIEAPHSVAEIAESAVGILAQCDCGWRKMCNNRRSATNSLTAHRRHCEVYAKVQS